MSIAWRRMLLLGLVASAGLVSGLRDPAWADEEPKADKPANMEANGASAPKYLLAFKFQPGQVVRYEVTQKSEITTIYSGATEVARNEAASRRTYKVLDVSPQGEGDLQLTIEWVRMSAKFDNANPIEFQSDDPKKHPPKFAHILETIGQPQATIRFSPAGQPLKVTSLKPAPSSDPAPAAGKASPPMLPGATAADASPENYLIGLPEQPVAIGDSWKERFEVVARENGNLPLRIAMLRSYTLKAVADGRATIGFRTAILTPIANNPAVEAQLIQRETSGTFVFDIGQGLILSREGNVNGTVKDPFGPGSSLRAVSSYQEKLLPVEAVARGESEPPRK